MTNTYAANSSRHIAATSTASTTIAYNNIGIYIRGLELATTERSY